MGDKKIVRNCDARGMLWSSKIAIRREITTARGTAIKENLNVSEIKIFNEYNFGSYLLYQGIPVFIDSRADLYAPEFNGKKNEDGKVEGRNIFSDYINIASISTYYEDKFDSYNITHIIIGKKSKLNMFLSRNDKYKELYTDDKFIIYERSIENQENN